jgi:Spy/CpxP family protein refolding chaperone
VKNPFVATAAALLVVLAVAYGCVAIYRGSWMLANANAKRSFALQQKNTNRQNQIAVQGNANQQGQLAALDNDKQTITVIEVQQLPGTQGQFRKQLIAQILGTGGDACKAAAQITSMELGSDRSWVRQNCQGGSLSPTSSLYKIK